MICDLITSSTTYILIDYENVQPTELRLPGDEPVKVKLFLGANQLKIPVSLATAMQVLGENAEYVQLESNGANALDFHIAYYIGRLAALEPAASFQIVSNDTGFDPLILHLKSKGVSVQRSVSRLNVAESQDDSDVEYAIDHLGSHGGGRPRSKKKLINSLRSLFRKERTEKEISAIFQSLCSRGIIKLNGVNIVYDSPSESEESPFWDEAIPFPDEAFLIGDEVPF